MKKLLLWVMGAALVLILMGAGWLARAPRTPAAVPAVASEPGVPPGEGQVPRAPTARPPGQPGSYAAPDRLHPSPPATEAPRWSEPWVPQMEDGLVPIRRAEEERDMILTPAAKMYWLRLPRPVAAKGIYLTGYTVANTRRFEALLELVERTELNAMVIDVKDDWGKLTYQSALESAREAGAISGAIEDLPSLIRMLRSKGIYPIARIVCFKDGLMPRQRPELAVHHVGGGLWRDRNGMTWMNPYNRESWEYLVEIAKEAAAMGFQEIQWDYVRFPTDGNVAAITYPGQDERTRWDVIAGFLEYAREELRPYGVLTSADIFGFILTARNDQGIGQLLERLAPHVDIISPMIYPSHWGPGNLGLPDPNRQPYQTVLRSMRAAQERLEEAGIKVTIRPWLQDFSLGGVKYGPDEVRAQIQATYDSQLDQWLLWNAGNVYTEGALLPAEN